MTVPGDYAVVANPHRSPRIGDIVSIARNEHVAREEAIQVVGLEEGGGQWWCLTICADGTGHVWSISQRSLERGLCWAFATEFNDSSVAELADADAEQALAILDAAVFGYAGVHVGGAP